MHTDEVPLTEPPRQDPRNFFHRIGIRKIVPLVIFLLLLILLPVGVFLSQQKQDVRSRAANTLETFNFILHLSKDPLTGLVTVENAMANTGFSQYYPALEESPSIYTDELEVLDGDTIVRTIPVSFVDYEFVDEWGENNESGQRKLSKPETFISFRASLGNTFRLRNIETNQRIPLASSNMTSALQNVQSPPHNTVVSSSQTEKATSPELSGTSDGYLDFVFISSNYTDTDFSKFDQDVTNYMNALVGVAPFSDYTDMLRYTKIYNTQTICTTDDTDTCDDSLIYQIASQVSYDQIVVAENSSSGSGRSPRIGLAMVSRNNTSTPLGATFVHELGHSFVWLNDEYDRDESDQGSINPFYNCDNSSTCSNWSSVPGTGCYPVCGYQNWYKSTRNYCVMEGSVAVRVSGKIQFDPVDEPAIRGGINTYIPIVPGSPLPGNPDWKWTTNWCVATQGECINAGFQRPAYVKDSYCADTTPYNCSGYQYQGSTNPTPTSPAPSSQPTLPSGSGKLRVYVKRKDTNEKFPQNLTVRMLATSQCNACNRQCNDPVCNPSRSKQYSGSLGYAQWSAYTRGATYTFEIEDIPRGWKLSDNQNGCSNFRTPTQSNVLASCTMKLEKKDVKTTIQGYVFLDDPRDPNAVKNSSRVEPLLSNISLSIFRRKNNGQTVYVDRTVSTDTEGTKNYSIGLEDLGEYSLQLPQNLSGYALHTCRNVTQPKNVPTDNRYFYCLDNKNVLRLNKWTPLGTTPYERVVNDVIPPQTGRVNVDFPLEEK